MVEIKEFVIPRDKWYRGFPHGSRLLRPDDGKQCCVGLYLSACGVPDSLLTDRAVGASMGPKWLHWNTSLYNVNDDMSLTEEWRESEVARLFKDQGEVVVRFVDSLEP